MERPAISVVIVNWNGAALLRGCLQSFDAADRRLVEVIVVDNGSTDGSVEMVRRDFPGVLVHAGKANVGFAEGCNIGIAAARAPWIATVNNDATLAPGWLDAVLAAIQAAPSSLGMLQCRLVFASDPSRANSTGVCLFPDGRAQDRDYGVPSSEASTTADVFCPTAGAALYRRAMLDDVRLETGWFDREFFLYGEDVDLGWRCRLAGWEAAYLPGATVWHAAHATTGRQGWRFVQTQCAKNRLRTIVKNASAGFLLRSAGRTAWDLVRIAAMGGPKALTETLVGARRSWRLRGEVAKLAKVRRDEVERRWAKPPSSLARRASP